MKNIDKFNLLFTKINGGQLVKPVIRNEDDTTYEIIHAIENTILYASNLPEEPQKNINLMETYLPDPVLRILRSKKDGTIKPENLKATWEHCTALVVRIRNTCAEWEISDQYFSSVELCKKAQEILLLILKVAWPNNLSLYESNLHWDGSLVLSFIGYDNGIPVSSS